MSGHPVPMSGPCVYLSTRGARLLPPLVVGDVRVVTLDLVALVDGGLPPLPSLLPTSLEGASGALWSEGTEVLSSLVEWRFPDRTDALELLEAARVEHADDPGDGRPEVLLAFCDETTNGPSVRGDVRVVFHDWSLLHGDADLGLLDWDDLDLPSPSDLALLPPSVARAVLSDHRELVATHAPEPLASSLLARLDLLGA